MTRLEALRALLAAVEAGDDNWPAEIDLALGDHISGRAFTAVLGSLDGVICLEGPLRQRGWVSFVESDGEFYAEFAPPGGGPKVFGRAPKEAHARLIAVIRALIQEEAPK